MSKGIIFQHALQPLLAGQVAELQFHSARQVSREMVTIDMMTEKLSLSHNTVGKMAMVTTEIVVKKSFL